MGVSKVVYDGSTLIDLTGDSVTADMLEKGATAHNAAGEQIVGTLEVSDFVVTATIGASTSTGAYSATVDKTFSEIFEAHSSGRRVIAKLSGIIFTLSMIDDAGSGMCVFTTVYNITQIAALTYSLTYNGSSWIIYQYNTPTALKNPNSLTINFGGTTVVYDGSEAKAINIDVVNVYSGSGEPAADLGSDDDIYLDMG
jgi:hypothetical protein|nr:MAG TPA: hypothetical protein [Caudoviricetes sp.]